MSDGSVYVNYELQRIRCGKSNCRCNTNDHSKWHGPYWYAYWNDPKTGKKRSKYVGKNFTPPGGGTRQAPYGEYAPPPRTGRADKAKADRERADRERADRERADREWSERQRERVRIPQDDLDAAALGVNPGVSQEALKRAWRRKIGEAHPDRYQGAERTRQEELAKEINAAYQRMMKRRGWSR